MGEADVWAEAVGMLWPGVDAALSKRVSDGLAYDVAKLVHGLGRRRWHGDCLAKNDRPLEVHVERRNAPEARFHGRDYAVEIVGRDFIGVADALQRQVRPFEGNGGSDRATA